MRVKPFIAESKKHTRIKMGTRQRERGSERTRERERERMRGSAFAVQICICIDCAHWRPTYLVYKRCRGGSVTVEL